MPETGRGGGARFHSNHHMCGILSVQTKVFKDGTHPTPFCAEYISKCCLKSDEQNAHT